MSAFADEMFQKWRGDWLPTIDKEIMDLHHRRQIWSGVDAMLIEQDSPDSGYFQNVFARMYIDGQAMGIRRQSEDSNSVISLARLIGQIAANPSIMTRERFLSMWALDEDEGDWVTKRAHDCFDEWSRRPAGPHVDPAIIKRDLASLTSTSGKVKDLADRTIAHTDKRGLVAPVTWKELDAATAGLGAMLKRYYFLLTAASKLTVQPVIQGDWRAPFRQPLAVRAYPEDSDLGNDN